VASNEIQPFLLQICLSNCILEVVGLLRLTDLVVCVNCRYTNNVKRKNVIYTGYNGQVTTNFGHEFHIPKQEKIARKQLVCEL
jgi:hypothetical protein